MEVGGGGGGGGAQPDELEEDLTVISLNLTKGRAGVGRGC